MNDKVTRVDAKVEICLKGVNIDMVGMFVDEIENVVEAHRDSHIFESFEIEEVNLPKKYKWILERWGIERVIVAEGDVTTQTLKEAHNDVTVISVTSDWSEWKKSTIQIDDRNELCLSLPIPCWEKEGMLSGKAGTITMWEIVNNADENG